MPIDAPALLTLTDIAHLAGVQRPAVSMWRTRTRVRGTAVPFPEPVQIVGGVEHFAVADVTAYLARTGRGNNRGVELDATVFAPPVGGEASDAEVLLTLAALTSEEVAT
ncbi:hypothetical protein M3677_17700, partial [Curtobacterium sp. P97]|nr:hypothetical protein [Curtobacterium sp. P97]